MEICKTGDDIFRTYLSWANWRNSPWIFAGWIDRDVRTYSYPGYRTPEELLARSLVTDHGETREYDEYPQGYVIWCKEPELG